MIKGFILMTEWVDKSEKEASKKHKKFIKEVKANDTIDVPDELGHKLMSQYEDHLEVVEYGAGSKAKNVSHETETKDAVVPENKMATPKETK